MKPKERAASPDSRVEYRWAADRDGGFEKSTFIYDAEGRLIAVDYATRRVVQREASITPAR
jgi:YD repeat-containing protein